MTDLFIQAGAIPCRISGGTIEVLLITTSSGKHLTIPKGLIEPGFSAVETVHNEAMEEAGIQGELLMPAIGAYRFAKWGGICQVEVYVMMVGQLLDQWPEAAMRRRMWVGYRKAAQQVRQRDLGQLIMSVPEVIGRQSPS